MRTAKKRNYSGDARAWDVMPFLLAMMSWPPAGFSLSRFAVLHIEMRTWMTLTSSFDETNGKTSIAISLVLTATAMGSRSPYLCPPGCEVL